MAQIQLLDQITIDKIAAGEVIERPASIVKELVENAIDAKASAITVEIKEGGISLIRISDNGCGIPKEEVPLAFLRHSTSKIRSVEDLNAIASLGFRGEALSSIAAVSQVEVITKTRTSDFGTKYVIEGGVEKGIDDVGASDGTTFLIHNIFFNTPARRKFLKSPMTEASHVYDILVRLALSHPEISIHFINNGSSKLHTSGNGKQKDVIYHIYGREITSQLLSVSAQMDGITVNGYIGKPVVSRGNRNFENYFINGRYVKSNIISRAIEDAYKDFSMQHKYPFTVLYFTMEGNDLDVNVHPTKMELRFSNEQTIYQFLSHTLKETLMEPELIPQVEVAAPISIPSVEKKAPSPLPVEKNTPSPLPPVRDEEYFLKKMKERVQSYHNQHSQAEVKDRTALHLGNAQIDRIKEAVNYDKPKQMNLFENKLLSTEGIRKHKLIGQLFETYWLVEYEEQLYIIDQHAAHERVLYEKTLHNMKNRQFTSQYLSPPLILDLNMQEAELLRTYIDDFTSIGFEIEPFGGDAFAVRAVPDNLFHIAKKDLLIEMLDQLSDEIHSTQAPDIVAEKIASMSCKAAVKGNQRLSRLEMDSLISDLLELENPYHCPHGRPTIIAMSKRELEKKFKRIV